ncbi:Retrovirus-related Pol polyprotein from transposon 412 [Frankliniella fusca]|uniref:RNA-directed DNA polymerase n=1 Tax=Frankliniella fusca TaxID=407009 RepID=A0AAE1H8T5_9NEOP|nr:Retrovirus-related Pol polyprotein from transposon 412 [Frankliniella fusca]
MIRAQNTDPDIRPVLVGVQADRKPTPEEAASFSPSARALWLQYESLVLKDGLLYRRFEHQSGDPSRERLQLVLPRGKVKEVLSLYHDAPGSGSHFGVQKTLARVRDRFYWPGYSQDVQDHCAACIPCGAKNGPRRKPRAPLRIWQEGSVNGRWSIDLCGPLRQSVDGHRYCLVAVENFTGFPECVPLRTSKADEVARALVGIWCRYGAPRQIRTDQGRQFESELLAQVLEIFQVQRVRTCPGHPAANGRAERLIKTLKGALSKVQRVRTCPGHPAANGRAERLIKTLKGALSKVMQHSQTDWSRKIDPIMLVYRSAVHPGTKYSPAQLMFGRQLTLPADLATLPPAPYDFDRYDLRGYPDWLRNTLRELHGLARENSAWYARAMESNYDRNSTLVSFQPGDAVWFFNPRRTVGLTPKLQSPWEHGWQVEEMLNSVVARIVRNNKKKCVHVDRLVRAAEDAPCNFIAPCIQLLSGLVPGSIPGRGKAGGALLAAAEITGQPAA